MTFKFRRKPIISAALTSLLKEVGTNRISAMDPKILHLISLSNHGTGLAINR